MLSSSQVEGKEPITRLTLLHPCFTYASATLICLALDSLGHLDFLDAALPLVDCWLAEVFFVIPLREAPLNGAGLLGA